MNDTFDLSLATSVPQSCVSLLTRRAQAFPKYYSLIICAFICFSFFFFKPTYLVRALSLFNSVEAPKLSPTLSVDPQYSEYCTLLFCVSDSKTKQNLVFKSNFRSVFKRDDD